MMEEEEALHAQRGANAHNPEAGDAAAAGRLLPATTATPSDHRHDGAFLNRRSHSGSPTMGEADEHKPSLFDYAHSRHADHRKPAEKHTHAQDHPISWKHLFRKPIVRQWLAGNVLVRETEEREAARFELFFDLAFVGIIHQLAEQATEDHSPWGIFKFIVFFWMSWSVWQDARSFINTSGTDDVPQRAYVLLVMMLLLGFSSNAAAILIECPEGTHAEGGAGAAAPVSEMALHLFQRAAESEAHGEEVNAAIALPGGCELLEGWEKSAHGAAAFYLVAKLIRGLLCLFYGWYLPRFRQAHFIRAGAVLVAAAFYIPLATLGNLRLFLVLPIAAIALELSASYVVAIWLHILHSLAIKEQKEGSEMREKHTSAAKLEDQKHDEARIRHFTNSLTPAISVEHTVERTSMFVVLVLGEMIINATFKAAGSQSGIHTEYLRCILCLLIAFFINWVYADADASRVFLHALRRHWGTSITWSHLHFPLCASLILASAAMPSLVVDDTPEQRFRWLFGGGLGVTMLCLSLIGVLHKGLDAPRSAYIPRWVRIGLRLGLAVEFAVLPLAHLSSTRTLAITALSLVFLVLLETFGKLGVVGSQDKIERAFQKRRLPKEEELEMQGVQREIMELGLKETEGFESELMDHERGEDDVGVEGNLSKLKVGRVGPDQRLAYAF